MLLEETDEEPILVVTQIKADLLGSHSCLHFRIPTLHTLVVCS